MRSVVRGVGALLALGEVAFVAALLGHGLVLSHVWWDRWVFPALAMGAAGLVLLRAGVIARRRVPWLVIGLGVLCSACGDLYYSIVLFGRPDASPSVADALQLGAYAAFYAGLMLLVRAESRQFSPSRWLDGLVAGLGLAALGALGLGPVTATSRGRTDAVVLLAYPLADVLLVSLVLGVLAAHGWRASGPWALLAAACVMNTAGDVGYLVLAASDDYRDGSVVDAVWTAAYLLLAAAAWVDQRAGEPLGSDGARVLVIPSVVTVSSLLVLLGDAFFEVPMAARLLAAGAITAVLVRTTLTFREFASLAETRRAARTDDLTGLANRREFYDRVTAATAPAGTRIPAAEHVSRSAVLLIDLDRFKEVNDSLGHHVGDELLVLVGRRLSERIRDSDTVARLGGDEFAVLLEGADLESAEKVAIALREGLEEPFDVGPSTLHISGSIGIAAYPVHAVDVHGLLRCADTAMYAAKAMRSGTSVYDPASSEHGRRNLYTAQQLRGAIETAAGRAPAGPAGTLLLRYQPKLHLHSGRVKDFEVLVRWRHPQRGLIPPGEFLPLGERAGLMAPLTAVVLHGALEQCRNWHEAGRELTVAVNVSATSLLDLSFSERIAALLEEFRLPASALVLEITESAIMADRDRCFDVLQAIHALGVRISVDDYGTGYSSLAYLQDLPVDEMKLDQMFISRMDADPRAAAIVTSTISLAHSLGLPLVAEGVETAAALEALAQAGCDYGQGYFIARPLSAPEVESWLDRRHQSTGRLSGLPAVRRSPRRRPSPVPRPH